jgi:hypothetical protein
VKKGKPGILLFSGSDKVPVPNVWFTHPTTKTKTKLCGQFLYDGYECSFAQCRFYHLASLAKIAALQQRELAAFVTAEPAVSWAPDRTPRPVPRAPETIG